MLEGVTWQRTLYVMFVAQLLSAVGFSMFFPFLPTYIEELGVASGVGSLELWVGLVFSAQAITMMIASPIWGAISDRVGRKLMVERALFGGAIIVGAMAFVGSAEQLVLLRAVQGLVTGVVSAANALIASVAPRERIGYAMGVLQVGLWCGLSIGPVIGGLLAFAYGPRAAFLVTALLLLSGGFLVLFGVKEEFVPILKGQRLTLLADWKHVTDAPGVNLTFLVRFSVWLGRTMIVPFLALFVASLLADQTQASIYTGLAIGIASATGTASAIYLGKLGDRTGHKPILVVSAVAAAVFYLPMSLVTAAWQLLVLYALTGAAIGGVLPALGALLAHYTEPGEEGSVYGLDNAIVAAARAASPLLGAAVVFWSGYRGTFVAAGLLFLVTAFLAAWYLPKTRPEESVPALGD